MWIFRVWLSKLGFQYWEILFIKEAWFLQIKIAWLPKLLFFPLSFKNVFIDSIDSDSQLHLPFYLGNNCQGMWWLQNFLSLLHCIYYVLCAFLYVEITYHPVPLTLPPNWGIILSKNRIQTLSMMFLYTRLCGCSVTQPSSSGVAVSVGDLFSDRSSHFTNLEALPSYRIPVDSVFYVHGHEGGNSFSEDEKAEKLPLQKLPLEPFCDASWYFDPMSSSLQSSLYFQSLCQQYLRKQHKEQFVFNSQFQRFSFKTILHWVTVENINGRHHRVHKDAPFMEARKTKEQGM